MGQKKFEAVRELRIALTCAKRIGDERRLEVVERGLGADLEGAFVFEERAAHQRRHERRDLRAGVSDASRELSFLVVDCYSRHRCGYRHRRCLCCCHHHHHRHRH